MKAIKIASKLAGLSVSPRKYSFTQGHYYLSTQELAELRDLVDENAGGEIRADFENEFAKVIGSGQAVSFASGRMAFYGLLKVLGVGPGDEVIIPAFTCAVMASAIIRTGARPIFSDINRVTLGSDPVSIKKCITAKTRVILAQHSFGIPCAIEDICDIGKKKGVFVVEDCAICLDSKIGGLTAGNFGGAAVFSTDHTKPLNTILGGAIYTTDSELIRQIRKFARGVPELSNAHKKSIYQRFDLERRFSAPEKYSRIVLYDYLRAAFKWCSSPVFLEEDYSSKPGISYPYPAMMPVFLAKLGILELKRWGAEREARRKLLKMYIYEAKKAGKLDLLPKAYFDRRLEITPLRFALLPVNRNEMIARLSLIDTDNVWFTTPLTCSMSPVDLGYASGNSPVTEIVCSQVLNLPTSVPEAYHAELVELFARALAAK